MFDIGKHKRLLVFMTMLVLLSFFSSAPSFSGNIEGMLREQSTASAGTEDSVWMDTAESGCPGQGVRNTPEDRISTPVVLSAGDCNLPDGTDSISLARRLLEDIAAREQNTTRALSIRFWVIALIIALYVCVIYRVTIRRYGCHMIVVWQNIYYIHQVDGKKGKRSSVYIK